MGKQPKNHLTTPVQPVAMFFGQNCPQPPLHPPSSAPVPVLGQLFGMLIRLLELFAFQHGLGAWEVTNMSLLNLTKCFFSLSLCCCLAAERRAAASHHRTAGAQSGVQAAERADG